MATDTGTTGTAPQSNDENVTEISVERLLKERKKAQARLAKAQADLARLKQQDKKLDTHFKILLGAWIVDACQKGDLSILELLEYVVQNANGKPNAKVKLPQQDLLEWIKLLDAEEPKKKN